jgi:hypothetical protein
VARRRPTATSRPPRSLQWVNNWRNSRNWRVNFSSNRFRRNIDSRYWYGATTQKTIFPLAADSWAGDSSE